MYAAAPTTEYAVSETGSLMPRPTARKNSGIPLSLLYVMQQKVNILIKCTSIRLIMTIDLVTSTMQHPYQVRHIQLRQRSSAVVGQTTSVIPLPDLKCTAKPIT